MRKSRYTNAYDRVLTTVFEKHWRPGSKEVPFTKDDLIDAASAIGLRIKNIADILYTYRSRSALPEVLRAKGNWVIASKGPGKYAFVSVKGAQTVEISTHIKVYPISVRCAGDCRCKLGAR